MIQIKKVGNNTTEGDDRDDTKDFNNYKGFQVRIEPHLGNGFENVHRLSEKKSGGKSESHINLNMWTRIKPGKYGLMSDECQNTEDDDGGRSFTKDDKYGNQPVGWAPKMPFGSARDFIVKVKSLSGNRFEVTVSMNGNASPILTGMYNGNFKPSEFDTMAITYTNSSRRYEYVKITDMKVISTSSDNSNNNGNENNTNGKGLVVEAEHTVLKGFETKSDSSASNGKYIYSNGHYMSGKNDNYRAEFRFNVPKSGKYKVRARVSSKGEDKGSDSFYLRVDGGSVKEFHTVHTSGWQTKDYKDTFNLQSGIRTVVLYARERKTCLDKLELVYDGDSGNNDNNNNNNNDNSNKEILKIEAENASLKGFKVKSDSKASNNKYIYSDIHYLYISLNLLYYNILYFSILSTSSP